MLTPRRKNKLGATKVTVGGIKFDSKAEARRYQELLLRQRAGDISDLELKPVYQLVPAVVLDGRKKPPLRYTPDFQYLCGGELVVEDVKGAPSTDAFRIRKHLMRHVHGINVVEVR
ncbi:MAG: DUF1064 domain-containing protein [Burkholderiales bacterium]